MELQNVLEELELLRDIPVTDEMELDAPFLHWDIGDDVHEIWHYYEEECEEFSMGKYLEGDYSEERQKIKR